HNLLDLSIFQQYAEVKSQVRSSTVQIFGSDSLTKDPVGYFQGTLSVSSALSRKEEMSDSPLNIINIRDVPILSLAMRADQVEGTAEESEIRDELHQMLLKREHFGKFFEELMLLLRGALAQRQILSSRTNVTNH
ncbi:hypothetical protein OSTOST_22661, partial [Ostertagia ostertagi]